MEQFRYNVLTHYVSLSILGVINLALMVLGIVVVNKPHMSFGAFEFLAISTNLGCAIVCFSAAYTRWRNPC